MLMHLWWFYRRYLKDEHKAKKGVELDCTKWTIGSLRASVSLVYATLKLLFFCITLTVAISVGDSTAEKWQRLWRFHL